MSLIPSKSDLIIPREEVGWGVMFAVGVRVNGMLVDVEFNSGVGLITAGAGEGGTLQAANREKIPRMNIKIIWRLISAGAIFPTEVRYPMGPGLCFLGIDLITSIHPQGKQLHC